MIYIILFSILILIIILFFSKINKTDNFMSINILDIKSQNKIPLIMISMLKDIDSLFNKYDITYWLDKETLVNALLFKQTPKNKANICVLYSDKNKIPELKNWLNNKIVGHCNGGSYGLITVVRKWIFLRAKNKCEECGCDRINSYTKKSVLQIDHIDGDASNSRPENLKLLCPTCHAMTSTYGYNMGRRSKRYHHRKMFRS